MGTTRILQRILLCAFTMCIAAESSGQTHFPMIQRFQLYGRMMVSTNEQFVAIIRQYDCSLFQLNKDTGRWQGPYESPVGGRIGTESSADYVSAHDYNGAWAGWSLEPDGTEVLILNPISKRAVELRDGQVRVTTPVNKILDSVIEKNAGRFRKNRVYYSRTTEQQKVDAFRKLEGSGNVEFLL